MTKSIPIPAGLRFGELTATGESRQNEGERRPWWRCMCDCGKDKWVNSSEFRKGRVKSCGTHHTQVSRDAARRLLQSKAKYPKETGSGTKLYRAWRAMKSRCTVPSDAAYFRYGGAGVSLFSEWLDYEPFRVWSLDNGFGDGLSIDRIDPFGNYEPENCRWVTMQVQARNNRVPCHMLTAYGETKLEVDWAGDLRCVVKQSTLRERIRLGWNPEKAITEPLGTRPHMSRATLTVFGETKTLRQWENDPRCHIGYEALRGRIRRGVLGEEALAKPLQQGFRRDLCRAGGDHA